MIEIFSAALDTCRHRYTHTIQDVMLMAGRIKCIVTFLLAVFPPAAAVAWGFYTIRLVDDMVLEGYGLGGVSTVKGRLSPKSCYGRSVHLPAELRSERAVGPMK